MMQELVWVRTQRGGHGELLRAVQRDLAAKRNLFWLVPEPYSHETEVMLARAGGAGACLQAEAVTFALLSERIVSTEGGLAQPFLDEGGRLLTLRRAIGTVAQRLRLFARAASNPAMLAELLAALDECKLYQITPRLLEQAAQLSEGAAGRLTELSYILGAYDAACAGSSMDSRDRYTLSAAKLREGTFGQGYHLYVSDFHSFTPQERNLLFALGEKAEAVHIYLCGEPGAEHFMVTARTAAALRRGWPDLQERLLPPDQSQTAPPLRHLSSHWFDREPPLYEEPHEALEITRAGSAAEECRACAWRIVNLCAEGYRFRDIHILYPDSSDYAPLLATIFPHYGIPLFMDQMDAAADKPLFRCVRAMLDCVLYNVRPADAIALLRTGLSPFSHEDIDRLEDYLSLWNFRGKRFTEGDFVKNPRGYGYENNPRDEAVLQTLNRPRQYLTQGIRLLDNKKKTAANHAAALFDALNALQIYDGLLRRTVVLERAGAEKTALENEQLWELLLHNLEQIAGVLGDDLIGLEEFGELLFLTLSGYSVGTIPATLDAVRAGGLGRFARIPAPVVILLGATGDALPARAGQVGFFGAEERRALEQLDLDLPPDEFQRLEREELNLYTAFGLAEQKLIVSYPSDKSVPLAEDEAAICVKQAAAMLNAPLLTVPPPVYPTEREPEPPAAEPPLSPAALTRLLGRTLALTPSWVRLYQSCPFAYFLRYGLRLKERPGGGLDARLVGSLLHEILEKSSAAIMDMGGFRRVDPQTCTAVARQTALDCVDRLLHIGQKASPRVSAQGRRVLAAAERLMLCLWEELNASLFTPHVFELRCESLPRALPSAPPDAPSHYLLKGIADRVDIYEQNGEIYLRVVDYKSGRTGFSFTELYNGTGGQLLQYLFMLAENAERYIPTNGQKAVAAGFLYLPTKTERVSAKARPTPGDTAALVGTREKRDGLLLDEPGVLFAMDDQYDKRPVPLLPVRITTSGTPDKRSKVASRSQMELLSRFNEELLRKTAEGIASGRFPPYPLYGADDDNACLYCDARPICGFDEEGGQTRPKQFVDREGLMERLAELYDVN